MRPSYRLDTASVSALVLDYLAERRSFELWAWGRFKAEVEVLSSDQDIQRGYDELLARFFMPAVLARRLRYVYGDPQSVDPERSAITAVRVTGRRAVVATIEDPNGPPSEPETYEYVIEPLEAGPRIADRRTRDGGGRWIHLVV